MTLVLVLLSIVCTFCVLVAVGSWMVLSHMQRCFRAWAEHNTVPHGVTRFSYHHRDRHVTIDYTGFGTVTDEDMDLIAKRTQGVVADILLKRKGNLLSTTTRGRTPGTIVEDV